MNWHLIEGTTMDRTITPSLLTREAFAEFGDVIDKCGDIHFPINNGMTERYHGLAVTEASGPDARVVISIAEGMPYRFPLRLTMVERHPFGSQAFIPLGIRPFLVVVCRDDGFCPGEPLAFITQPGQGVNYRQSVWHGVLTPIGRMQDFLIVDRDGAGTNLEVFEFPEPYDIRLPPGL
ncbi:ureidoglycolate lyase [Bradyrhizobium sp. BR13661]|nr:ureidoglycolate lyase [Bradyrhizobium sp. BR13661]